MRANKYDEHINALLEKYKLDLPISNELKSRSKSNKNTTFKAILKEKNAYSPLKQMFISFYIKLKRRGFTMSFNTFQFSLKTAFVTAMILCIATPVLILQTMKSTKDFHGYITFTTGSPTVTRTDKENLLALKNKISTGSVIKTNKKSISTIGIKKLGLFSVLPKSKVKIASLTNKTLHLSLHKGTLILKINKKVYNDIKVYTPNSIIKVTGTTFSVSYLNNKTKVSLTHGKLNINNRKTSKDILLEKGKKVTVIANTFTQEKVTQKDVEHIQLIEEMPKLENYEKLNKTIIKEKVKKIKSILKRQTLKKEIKSTQLTLQGLRKKYNRLDIITDFHGKVYKGIILTRGKSFILLTPKGKISIPKDNIKNISH